jgi:hypothetical protein
MSLNRRDGLASELSMIEAMLRQIPRGRVIERIGLEGRAAELREEIEGLGPGPRTIALTFRGAPVDGSRAIVADFAGKALAAFSDAVGTLVASITGELAESGPLSGSPERSLRVLGPALGSFGFEIELPEPAIDRQVTIFDPQGQDPYEAAIQEAIALVSAAQGDDEESLAERVSSVHPRALAKVREFIDLLTKREASFALRADHLRVEVQDVDAARRIAGALADNDIKRAEIEVRGRLFVLPARGQFELATEHDGVLGGRIERRAGDTRSFVDKLVVATLQRLQVRQSRPRYTLLRVSGVE